MIGNTDFEFVMKLASKACLDADVAEFDSLDTEDITINPKTTQKVKRVLFFKTVQESQTLKVLKKITVACLLVCTILFGAAMSVQPIRAAIVNAVVTWYERYIGILFVEDEEKEYPTVIEEVILPPLDEGWKKDILLEARGLGVYIFTNSEGQEIYYDQQVYRPNEMIVDNNGCVVSEIVLNNNVYAKLCTYEDETIIVLWENGYLFSLSSEQLSAEYLIEIASKMCD